MPGHWKSFYFLWFLQKYGRYFIKCSAVYYFAITDKFFSLQFVITFTSHGRNKPHVHESVTKSNICKSRVKISFGFVNKTFTYNKIIINEYLPTCGITGQDTTKEDNVDEALELQLLLLLISCTFMVAKQVARYFFISTSEPGSSLRDRCVRCLKALVSTMFRLAEPLFSAVDSEESCSKNLQKPEQYSYYTSFVLGINWSVCIYSFMVTTRRLEGGKNINMHRNRLQQGTQVLKCAATT